MAVYRYFLYLNFRKKRVKHRRHNDVWVLLGCFSVFHGIFLSLCEAKLPYFRNCAVHSKVNCRRYRQTTTRAFEFLKRTAPLFFMYWSGIILTFLYIRKSLLGYSQCSKEGWRWRMYRWQNKYINSFLI